MKTRTLLFFIFSFAVTAFAQEPEQRWPKLMQLFAGRIVEVRYLQETGFTYYDHSGRLIPDMKMQYDDKAAKYLFVDSTGKPISDARYDDAYPFRGGVALITTPGRYVYQPARSYAIINERSELISPFTSEPKYLVGNGLYVVDKKTKQEVYNVTGKKIAECEGCGVMSNSDMKHILMSPRSDQHDFNVVRILDLEGRQLYYGSGEYISQITNDISTNEGTYLSRLPYYELVISSQPKAVKAVISAKGKVVMDSIDHFFFSRGMATITKNNRACVVDTNFKTLIPYSLGYDFYRQMYLHPQGAFCARKNGKFSIINASGKQLVPLTSETYEIWYKPDMKLYEARDAESNMWFVSLTGDTIVSPLKYTIDVPLYPLLPGYIVKPKGSELRGYISGAGRLKIPCEYEALAWGGKDLLIFFKGDKAGYLDTTGNVKFYIEGALRLSSFFQGYALCSVKMSDAGKASPSAQTVFTADGTYQVQNLLIDSTGKFVSEKTYDWLFLLRDGYANVIKNGFSYMVDKKLEPVVINGSCQLMTYFHDGLALAYDCKKNTWGLANDKLQMVIPAIYDKIETKEEDRGYGYSLISKEGYDHSPGFTNYFADIREGRLKVILKGKEEIISVPK